MNRRTIRRRTRLGYVAATTIGLVAATTGRASAAPAPAAAPPAATAPATSAPQAAATAASTVRLVPNYLPPGYVPVGVETVTTPDVDGGVATITTARYAPAGAPVGPDRPTLYLQVVRSALAGERDPNLPATPMTLGGRSGVFVDTGAVREFSFAPSTALDDVEATVGAVGIVATTEIMAVADNLSIVDGAVSGDDGGDVASNVDLLIPPGGEGCDCPSSTNMKGTGAYQNDWSGDGPNRTLYQGYTGNDVGIWQGVLWADGEYYFGTYRVKTFTDCLVDGQYGGITLQTTQHWQESKNLNPDGVVGPNTWGRADDKLVARNGFVFYTGAEHQLVMKRKGTSPYDYTWSWAGSSYKYTGYSGRDIKAPSDCQAST
jgi:hypothetical protein